MPLPLQGDIYLDGLKLDKTLPGESANLFWCLFNVFGLELEIESEFICILMYSD